MLEEDQIDDFLKRLREAPPQAVRQCETIDRRQEANPVHASVNENDTWTIPESIQCQLPATKESPPSWRKHFGNPYDPETDIYHREPFVADIREGKNDQIYNAHSYHTKVPPRAIIPYILHYTDPGDIVLDPFCATG